MLTGEGPHSNSAARTMTIIEFLAARPRETFSISEIARRVGVNKSTAYTLIHTLHRGGWVFRSPSDLRYGIGPVLTTLGEAAGQALPEVSLARPVMRRLAAEFRRECVFSTLIGDEIVVLHTTGPAELGSPWSRPGLRTPCTPPFGTVFMAWREQAEQKEWYERGSVVNTERFEQLEEDLRAIRNRGFVATLRSTVHSQLGVELAQTATPEQARRVMQKQFSLLTPVAYLLGGGSDTDTVLIDQLQAPIFDERTPLYALTVRSVEEEVDLGTVSDLGNRVRAACDEVTAAISELRRDRAGKAGNQR